MTMRDAAVLPPSREEFLSQYVSAGMPVLMKGVISDWPAVKLWTPEYLAAIAAAMGDIQVPYRSTPPDMARLEMQRIQKGTMSLLDILNECARSPEEGYEIYVPGLNLPPRTPLARDVAIPSQIADREVYATTVFLGRNTKCIGHFHPKTQALLCQVQGVKRVWMYPPAELGKLYLFPVWSDGFFRSQVNYYGDRIQFPRVAAARVQVFELHPGDALFIPLHWLHVPEGMGWNVSVTHWWRPAVREWPFSLASARALLGIGFEWARQMAREKRPLH